MFMKLSEIKRNPWPYGLGLFFIVFTSYIAGFIGFACRPKMDFVREDYYNHEIRFQQQIDRIQRTQPALATAAIEYNRAGAEITVSLPAADQNGLSGAITLYRPADAALDSNIPLGLNAAGRQIISVRALASGLWKVRVQWKASGQEYYCEKSVVIQPTAAS